MQQPAYQYGTVDELHFTTELSARSLDKHAGGPQLRAALLEATKQRTDPYIFINQVNDLNILLTGNRNGYHVISYAQAVL
jgi:hypothetical protein